MTIVTKRAINVDLDLMIKRASEKKTNLLKKAEGSTSAKLDALDGHEVKPTTGATAADNKAHAGDSSEASVDAGAKDNPENGSVANNTDGSTAAATNGQSGAKGSEIAGAIKDADNGPTDKNKFAADKARELAKELRKAASELLTPFDHFLVKQARSTDDPKVKTAMEAMADDDVAGQASDTLMQQLSTGQISDDDAKQILEEALKAGALTPEELEAAAQVVQQHAGGGDAAAPAAPGGDAPPAPMDGAGPVGDGAAPGGDVPPAAPAAPMDGAAPDAAPVPEDIEAKIAAAEIDPSDPKYVEKIGSLYKDAEEAGKQLFGKVAEYLIANEPQPEVKPDEAKVAADKKAADEKKSDPMSGVNLAPSDEAEKQALAAVKQELGIDDKQLAELAATPLPASNDKVAAAVAQYRVAILTKVAALKK